MGIVVVAALAASAAASPAKAAMTAHLTTNQIGRQRRQPLVLTFRPAVLDRHVLALDIAGVLQALAESRADGPRSRQAIAAVREIRSPASPAAARAPRAATQPPRRRAA